MKYDWPAHDPWRLGFLALATSLAAGGVAALNQWLEVDTDSRMARTSGRPIPAGRVTTGSAFVLGCLMCIAALMLMFARVGPLAALFTLLTIITYLGWYTPAKRTSRWSTEIGAVAGAFPRRFHTPSKPSDPGVILFTSGSFGAPRGVILTQANLVANLHPGSLAYQGFLSRSAQALVHHGSSAPDAAREAQGMAYGLLLRHANMMAFADTFWIMGVLCLALLPLIFFMRRTHAGKGPLPAGE